MGVLYSETSQNSFKFAGTFGGHFCRKRLDRDIIFSKREVYYHIQYIRFRYDNPIRYLPLVYLLPWELLDRFHTLRKLPRNMRAVLGEWAEVVQSDVFHVEIMDAFALLVFPYFGFSGWLEQYTGYCPLWTMAYCLPLWAKGRERETNWGLHALFKLSPDCEIPYFDPDSVKGVIKLVVQQTIDKQGWQPILDTVREMPCAEDFEPWGTNVRKDFLRKWHHTRSKRVQTVSLEECLEDESSGIRSIPDPAGDFTAHVEAEDFCQRFKATLSEKDMAILELRVEGYSYKEIADKLGYKNHSGVIKRMESIKKRFIQYEEEAGR